MTISRRTAVRGWAVAVLVYFFAVFNRSSLGVAGLAAEHRFDIGPGALSVFVMLQIGVYSAMQIPTGVLVDRYGPKRLLIAAATIMAAAQLGFAAADSYPLALVARGLLGCGDALTFISVLRFSAAHFSPRRYPILVALTALLGTVGNVGATVPLTALLDHQGWTTSFVVAGLASAGAGLAVILLVRDETAAPRRVARGELAAGTRKVGVRVRAAWAVPGTRLGFWVHFACMAAGTPFAVLWGHPYLVEGAHFSDAGASRLLMVSVIAIGVANASIGVGTARWPIARIPLAIGSCAVSMAVLVVVVCALGDHPAKAVAAVAFVIILLGGPFSMIAFAVTRDYNTPSTLGTASGVVNVAGWVGTVVASVAFGVVLDLQGGSDQQSMRFALLVLVAVQAFGTSRLIVWYRRVRADIRLRQAAGELVPVPFGRNRWFDIRELEGPEVLSETVTSQQIARSD